MPFDIQNFTLTHLAAVNVSVPRIQISCRLVETGTNNVLLDLTGANTVLFPNLLSTLTQQQRQDILMMILTKIASIRLGIDT